MEVRQAALDQNETISVNLKTELSKGDGVCPCCFWKRLSLLLTSLLHIEGQAPVTSTLSGVANISKYWQNQDREHQLPQNTGMVPRHHFTWTFCQDCLSKQEMGIRGQEGEAGPPPTSLPSSLFIYISQLGLIYLDVPAQWNFSFSS